MFEGETAWFSSAVDKSYRELWKKHGGVIVVCPEVSCYAFGSDPVAEDAIKIFNSMLYSCHGITIFTPSWIDAAIDSEKYVSHPIDDFMLRPMMSTTEAESVQRKKTRYDENFDKAIKQNKIPELSEVNDMLLNEESIDYVYHKLCKIPEDVQQKGSKKGKKRKLYVKKTLRGTPSPAVKRSNRLNRDTIGTDKNDTQGDDPLEERRCINDNIWNNDQIRPPAWPCMLL